MFLVPGPFVEKKAGVTFVAKLAGLQPGVHASLF
jgi:hypothetical protein